MRLYISGKITGNENYKEDFAAAKNKLENAGYDVCSPTAFDFPEDISWTDAMKYDICEMICCDGVALLPSWKESKGARVEARLAKDLEIMVKPISDWLKG
ncbi:MAG: DUF4406 domain-containing protein [Treponema sp.]|jgi:hypothetical protein|nr:DUF4406 domain-containing protein [Treponema sp.]